MSDALQDAATHRADFSPAFADQTGRIACAISELAGVPAEHVTDMNYSACHRIRVAFDSAFTPVAISGDSVQWRVDFLLSSKARYYTRVLFEKTANVWRSETFGRLLEPASKIVATISESLDGEGWQFVDCSELQVKAGGLLTEMDGIPATLFEALFTELL